MLAAKGLFHANLINIFNRSEHEYEETGSEEELEEQEQEERDNANDALVTPEKLQNGM